MKVRFNYWYNTVLAALLGLLGFEACDGPGADEYGCPWAEYQVKGVITDESGQPIPGIRVELAEHAEEQDYNGEKHVYHRGLDTMQTDAQGKYQTHVVSDLGCNVSALKIIIEDVDGPENGGDFQSDTLIVPNLEKTLVKKSDGWYNGKYELKGDVTLKPKTQN